MAAFTEEIPPAPQIVRADQGTTYQTGPETFRLVIPSAMTGGAFHMAEVKVDAPSFGPPYHVHEQEDEMFMVLEGELIVTIDGVRHTLKKGDTAFAPRNVPHRYESGPNGVHFTVTVTGSNFERFFPRFCEAVGIGAFDTIPGIAAEHGITLLPEA